ncbi:hypothetical protein LY15_002904 [Prauserella flava]|uniref:Uncharacterized protein n=1 Tax=Prauserella sediminis TaxID=577680 RepID=A0A839XTC9_9PSEU|nr:hypothetical protein [Prauserella sediminis]MCR3720917.1 hypothetical protein [Prauserella flava]MCR3735002.1 hypothetical protein [Prauserella salsuginis]
MTVWFVIAVPLAVMLFALGMERVETRLRHVSVRGEDVEEFLEQAKPEEVRALYGHGIGRALELFRRRRFSGRSGGRFGKPRRGDPDREPAQARTSASATAAPQSAARSAESPAPGERSERGTD